MPNSMQLISALLLLFSVAMLVGAILFVARWHRTFRKVSLMHILREDVGHVGVSAIVAYPETIAPLLALLEEEYPRSEVVVIADLQGENSGLGEAVGLYRLVKVNHAHLEGVRALYRSRRRAFRRVVVVDLPAEYRSLAKATGRAVAAYDNLLYLQGESIVEQNAITYCANVVAAQHSAKGVLMRSIVGAEAHLERGDVADAATTLYLRADCPLAWNKSSISSNFLAVLVAVMFVAVAATTEDWLLLAAVEVAVVTVLLFIYLSCSVVTEKSLLVRLRSVFQNFYRYWVERAATRQGSKTRDTSLRPLLVRVRNRPARYREGARPER